MAIAHRLRRPGDLQLDRAAKTTSEIHILPFHWSRCDFAENVGDAPLSRPAVEANFYCTGALLRPPLLGAIPPDSFVSLEPRRPGDPTPFSLIGLRYDDAVSPASASLPSVLPLAPASFMLAPIAMNPIATTTATRSNLEMAFISSNSLSAGIARDDW